MIHTPVSPLSTEGVGFTAYLVAWLRAQSSIPYAKVIADLIGAEEVISRTLTDEGDRQALLAFAPVLELRHRSITGCIEYQGSSYDRLHRKAPVVSLASGFSPISLELSVNRGFVDTDLPHMTTARRQVLEKVRNSHKQPHHQKIFVRPANVLDIDELWGATHLAFMKQVPDNVIFTAEGLLPYFTHTQKKVFLGNIFEVLEHTGGMLVLTDILLRERLEQFMSDERLRHIIELIMGITGADLIAQCFSSWAESQEMLYDIGYSVTPISQSYIYPAEKLSTIVGEPSEPLLTMLGEQKVCILHPRNIMAS